MPAQPTSLARPTGVIDPLRARCHTSSTAQSARRSRRANDFIENELTEEDYEGLGIEDAAAVKEISALVYALANPPPPPPPKNYNRKLAVSSCFSDFSHISLIYPAFIPNFSLVCLIFHRQSFRSLCFPRLFL